MKLKTLFGAIAAYILLLFRHGYVFGSGDQSEMLPYAKYLADNSLYTKDFYIQSIAAFVPNERLIFSKGLSFFVDYLPELTFAVHSIATIFLILGLYRLAQIWLTTESVRWIAALAPIFILYNINLGGNELYYNSLTPSYLAQVVGLWAFVLIFNGYIDRSYLLICLATYIHPLIGIQLWLIVVLIDVFFKCTEEEYETWTTIILINIGYLLTAGFYVFRIKNGYDAGNISNETFLNIIEFRAPHHYFPNYFPLLGWFILMPLFFIYYIVGEPLLRLLLALILGGCVVYTFGVLVMESPTIMSVQWFSTTIWLKTFSIMICIGLIESFFLEKKGRAKWLIDAWFLTFLVACSFMSLIFMTPQYRLFKNKNYDFLTTELIKTPDVNIALKAKELTPRDALFLIPSDVSSFRYWSERSIFIDYKAINHRQTVFGEWYKRIQNVYKISLDDRLRNADLPYLANENFKQLKENDFLQFAQNQGITHVLTFKNCVLNFPKIGENEAYILYKIQ